MKELLNKTARTVTIELTRRTFCEEEEIGHKQYMTFDLAKITPWALNAILNGDPEEEYSYAHDYDVRILEYSNLSTFSYEMYQMFLKLNAEYGNRFSFSNRGSDSIEIVLTADSSCKLIAQKRDGYTEVWDSRISVTADGRYCKNKEQIRIAIAEWMCFPKYSGIKEELK